jgi:peptide/nickel transport system substrate-binding protein
MPYSPSKAKALLTKDGWKVGKGGIRYKNGKPLAITILSNSNQPWPLVSQILQEELAQIGFKASIVTQNWGTFLNSGRAGDYNIAYWGLGGFSTYTWDGTVNMNSTNYWNISQMKDNPSMAGVQKEIDQIYNTEIAQTNVAQRSATLLKFQELDYKDMLVGWLWTPLELFAVSPQLHNYAFNDWMYLFLNSHSTLGGR